MSDDPLSETPTQALARRARQSMARQVFEVTVSGEVVEVPVCLPAGEALVADQLYIGFFNKSGRVPMPEDFEGLANKTDEERAEMGLAPRGTLKLLEADTDRPFVTPERVGFGPMHPARRRRYLDAESGVFNAQVRVDATSWVTHFAIGTRRSGIIAAGQFNRPTAMAKGATMSFGVRLADLKPEAPRALPSGNHEQIEAVRERLKLPSRHD